jgi:D-alanine-D-alanine ligase
VADLDRVLVLAGGLSPEREVSLRSGNQVAQALAEVGVDVRVADVGVDLLAVLAADAPDVVFPMLHGASGEDGTLREVLHMAGVSYVGAQPSAARLAFDKPVAKTLLSRAGLHTPESVTLPRQAFHDLGATALAGMLTHRLGLPLAVKPRGGGSAFGVTRVDDAAMLPAALMTCFGYHDEALVERWVAGTEVAVAVIDTGSGPTALPAVEIVPDSGFYDYAARYTAGATEFFSPARLSDTAAEAAAQAALTAHRVLGLRDLSRTDIIVDSDGRPFVLETNVAPGMTSTSTFPMALREAGFEFGIFLRDVATNAATNSAARAAIR